MDCHSSEARVQKAADCESAENRRRRFHTTSANSESKTRVEEIIMNFNRFSYLRSAEK